MRELLRGLTQRLEELGLRVEVGQHSPRADSEHDVDVVLSRDDTRQRFKLVLERRATVSNLTRKGRTTNASHPLLVGAETVSPRSADSFRRAGVQYVDTAGNAWITFAGVLIDVRGRRPSGVTVPGGQGVSRAGGNLFSTGRAQVAFVLLQWPRTWKKPQRDVAHAAGVSLGQTHNALVMFREAGFGPGGHRSSSEFLDLWVSSYPSGLARKLVLATYRGSLDTLRELESADAWLGDEAVVSGDVVAADLRRPVAMTIYVAALDPMLPVKNRWRSDGDPNITVRRRFWQTPPDEPSVEDGVRAGLRHAPAVLVYADLFSSDDPRVRDAAVGWRQRIARPERTP